MALIGSIAPRCWRAVQHALGIPALRAVALGTALSVSVGSGALTPRPASAAPLAAALSKPKAAKAKSGKRKAAKVTKATKAKVTKAAKSKATKSKATKRTSRSVSKARRSSVRSASRRGGRRSERRAARATPAPRPSADLVELPVVAIPDIALAAAAPGTPPGQGTLTLITRSASSLLDGLLTRARSQLGTRYVYGATSPDDALDCSSFARYVMEALNVRLPRTANQQARVGTAVPRDLTALRPGDLLTFGSPRRTSHVGIYLGAGRFIHASVKSGQVIETTVERNRALFRRWQGARRLIAGAGDAAADSVAFGG